MRRQIAALLCAILSQSAVSAGNERLVVEVVASDNSLVLQAFSEKLTNRLGKNAFAATLPAPIVSIRGGLYVSAGLPALRATLAKGDAPIIATFITSAAFRDLHEELRKSAFPVGAIFQDPNPIHQISLIERIFRHPTKVAVLISERSSYLIPIIKRATESTSVELVFVKIDTSQASDLNRALNEVSDSSALLAIPDGTIYSPENIRSILLSTYRHLKPVIGFSTAFVSAGALATTFSTTEDIADQTVEIIDTFMSVGRLPEPQFAKYFQTAVNDSVARSLSIGLDNDVKSLSRKKYK